jgi:pantoate--beta-alanine ligase
MCHNSTKPTPQLITSVAELRNTIAKARHEGTKIGLVPTMGALHEGHLSLVRASQCECGLTVVSVYVNPTQFGPTEDFSKYPRTLDADLQLLAGAADVVFAPSNEEMYPQGFATLVEVSGPAEPLEGAFRPGHFRGVATIVLKLFNMVQPDVAYFGQKDYQQTVVIRRMSTDLNVPVEVRVCPIVRERDGLAMSSRNRYLSPEARCRALVLSQSLQAAKGMVAEGCRDAKTIAARMQAIIETAADARIDYIALVDADTLLPVDVLTGRAMALLAVKIENTRLIDNCELECAAKNSRS